MQSQAMPMAMSQTKCCHNPGTSLNSKNVAGLTLIEVLIALAIVAIAMTAVIKAASQNIRATTYLQDKTIATWVGQQVLNEVRVGTLNLPGDDKLNQMTNMLGREWTWEASQVQTANKRIYKIEVNVFANKHENDEATPIVTLESYVYHEQ
jgi:general secretion pathway protein I